MLEVVKTKTIYRNKKNKQLYRVEAVGTHTETEEGIVYYIPLYEAPPEWRHCFRPLELFKVKFERVNPLETDQ